MPLRNRVDPWGRIVADPARGALLGNRGILHDESGTVVREHANAMWIACRLDFNGRYRSPRQPDPRRYTQLFLFDEATAFAAGHRPCGECRRADYREFKRLWAVANPDVENTPKAMDRALRAERRAGNPPVTVTPPEGAVVTDGTDAYLRWNDAWLRWSFEGYTPAAPAGELRLLTPPSIVRMLEIGLLVAAHPSAG
ncbi:hypothetical protein FK529_16495 [Tsukamurella asaccharolytica]|uniref:Ada DNA repair metal-binding domain-containing protein n=1 Tax=Tsukamurella asaccharolytica TaxID=2592067 RepID=A0A5C5R7A5_9ACTN|nr:hypothetical protein [Tsukamurella asaccharolytica]TWS18294.1 hypothetical protein FK529_16495 [Tsukamurella asaccharolytica]